jgi:glycosyltransferase involved in cell wall biosynthesis
VAEAPALVRSPSKSAEAGPASSLRVLMISRGVVRIGANSGGAELVAFALSLQLAAAGDEVVFVGDLDPSLQKAAPRLLQVQPIRGSQLVDRMVHAIPYWFPRWMLQHLLGNLRAARSGGAILRRDQTTQFDLVHVHGALATLLLARSMARLPHRPAIVYTEHDATPWSCRYRHGWERALRCAIYRVLNLRACRAANLVITPFEPLALELASRAGLPTSRFATVPNGVLVGGVANGTEPAVNLGWKHGFRRYCLFVGALTNRKAPDLLLQALATVDLPCIFVGDGPMRAELEQLTVRLGLASRVAFTGALSPSEVRHYYQDADFLVLPSVSEGVPLVALEALSSGIPVLASRLDGIATVVRDGYNGLLVEPGNVDQLASALSQLETDPSLRRALGSHASPEVRSTLTWPRLAGQLHMVYARTCRPNRNVASRSYR